MLSYKGKGVLEAIPRRFFFFRAAVRRVHLTVTGSPPGVEALPCLKSFHNGVVSWCGMAFFVTCWQWV